MGADSRKSFRWAPDAHVAIIEGNCWYDDTPAEVGSPGWAWLWVLLCQTSQLGSTEFRSSENPRWNHIGIRELFVLSLCHVPVLGVSNHEMAWDSVWFVGHGRSDVTGHGLSDRLDMDEVICLDVVAAFYHVVVKGPTTQEYRTV